MARKLQADYDGIARIANQLSQEAQNIAEMTQKIKADMGELQDGKWVGDDANTFYQQMEEDVLPTLQRLTKVLGNAGSFLHTSSGKLAETEESVRKLFQRV